MPLMRSTYLRDDRVGYRCGRRAFVAMTVAGLLGMRGVPAQFDDGGTVDMSCSDPCVCEGESGAGNAIEVFDIPSSGQRVRCSTRLYQSYIIFK